jgi:hypothetical protein
LLSKTFLLFYENIMTTIQQIIDNNLSLTRSQLKADKALVIEIQTKLANLGFYPGGGWIDGDLGGVSSFSWKGLIDFCTRIGNISIPSNDPAIDLSIAEKLRDTLQVDSILVDVKNTSATLNKLKKIQDAQLLFHPSRGVTDENAGFLARTINKSPIQKLINNYPTSLEQKPDGTSIISYGDSVTLATGVTVNFSDYPDRGNKPTIDNTSLNFLASNISHACVCVGSFKDSNSPIKTHWLGKNAFQPEQMLSATKFIGVLNAVCQINEKFPNTDVDDCTIEPSNPRYRFNALVEDMVSYQENFGHSNRIGAMFKRFTERQELEKWIKDRTGSTGIEFRGGYGQDFPPLIDNPIIKDTTTGQPVLSFSNLGAMGNNLVSTYDLVRLISMLGWHLHLAPTARLPSAQWKSLESVVRAMGNDTARYVDVALETLGIVKVISEPVIISKVGWGTSSMTYAAFVKFIDRRTTPGKLRTFALALRCPTPNVNTSRDTHLAAAVTEIVRRIFTEELA